MMKLSALRSRYLTKLLPNRFRIQEVREARDREHEVRAPRRAAPQQECRYARDREALGDDRPRSVSETCEHDSDRHCGGRRDDRPQLAASEREVSNQDRALGGSERGQQEGEGEDSEERLNLWLAVQIGERPREPDAGDRQEQAESGVAPERRRPVSLGQFPALHDRRRRPRPGSSAARWREPAIPGLARREGKYGVDRTRRPGGCEATFRTPLTTSAERPVLGGWPSLVAESGPGLTGSTPRGCRERHALSASLRAWHIWRV